MPSSSKEKPLVAKLNNRGVQVLANKKRTTLEFRPKGKFKVENGELRFKVDKKDLKAINNGAIVGAENAIKNRRPQL